MIQSPVSLLIAGGGTGGHLLPGIALAKAIKTLRPEAKITFLVPGKPVDVAIMKTSGFTWYVNPMRSLPSSWLHLPEFLHLFLRGWAETLKVTRISQPDIVVGLGGYGSLSAGLLAILSGTPLVTIESNTVAGKVVRWLANRCAAVYSGGEVHNIATAKLRALGIPIRSELPLDKVAGNRLSTVLVMGGSQGASCLNRVMCEAAPLLAKLDDSPAIVHLCGKAADEILAVYQKHNIVATVLPFANDMASLYRQADLVVSRAGGSTLAELTAIGLPAILVPFAQSAEQHQLQNALQMKAHGAALVIAESELTAERLVGTIVQLSNDRTRLQQLAIQAKKLGKPNAASAIAHDILSMANLQCQQRIGTRGNQRITPSVEAEEL